MTDRYPSITAADLNRAADLLGLYSNRPAVFPPDVKADLVEIIRREVRLMQAGGAGGDGVATAVHPELVALVERAEGDWADRGNRIL